jgi:PIN domain nuclease of toxin-antitoxin system
MKYLLDTNIFLFSLSDSARLSGKVVRILEEPSNELHISLASLWEIAIKHSLKKIQFPDGLKKTIELGIETLNLQILPIRSNHLYQISELPLIHNDPFDRILVAQCLEEKISLVSTDKILKKYKVPLIIC